MFYIDRSEIIPLLLINKKEAKTITCITLPEFEAIAILANGEQIAATQSQELAKFIVNCFENYQTTLLESLHKPTDLSIN